MKILTSRCWKIARITLWATVVAIVVFIAFTTGGMLILSQIEHECLTNHMFQIKDHGFKCELILKGILS